MESSGTILTPQCQR